MPKKKRKGLTLEQPGGAQPHRSRADWKPRRNRAPPLFSLPETARLITIGNFEDNLGWCGEVDWIIEAVAENLEIKRKLLTRVEQHRKPGTIVTTNTSGLPIHSLPKGAPRIFSSIGPGRIFSIRRAI